MKKHLFLACIIAAAISSISAEVPEIRTASAVDWTEGTLKIELTVPLNGKTSPADARAEVRDLAEAKIGSFFCEALYDISIDSYRSVKSYIQNDPAALAALLGVGESGEPSLFYMSSNFASVTAKYEFSLYPDVTGIFIEHSSPYEQRELLGFNPSADYTGLVIYAQGEYPVHGEEPGDANPDRYRPALFPKIYDTDMRLIAESRMMEPAALATWGTAGFTGNTNYLENQERVGPAPLLTMARALFGLNRSDILIPKETADRLLASDHNRKLLREGRILIIYDID